MIFMMSRVQGLSIPHKNLDERERQSLQLSVGYIECSVNSLEQGQVSLRG